MMPERHHPKVGFKSDRCGIETTVGRNLNDLLTGFKSDRCGIETKKINAVLDMLMGSNQTVAGLKQN